MNWIIHNNIDILYQLKNTSTPTTANSGIDLTGLQVVQVPRPLNLVYETINFSTGAIISNSSDYDDYAAGIIDKAYESSISIEGPVKAAEHQRKLEEAKAYKANSGISNDLIPLLYAEATTTSVSVNSLADAVILKAQQDRINLDNAAVARREVIASIRAAASIPLKQSILNAYMENITNGN